MSQVSRIIAIAKHDGIIALLSHAVRILKQGGMLYFISRITTLLSTDINYPKWIKLYDTITDDDRNDILSSIALFTLKPLISIIIPACKLQTNLLNDTIDSLQKQLYRNWELYIILDARNNQPIQNVMSHYAAKDPRIKFLYNDGNDDLAPSLNLALSLATGEYITLLDQSARLPAHSLFWMVNTINKNLNASILYSDEDSINHNHFRHSPNFKSDFNYELFLAQNMIGHYGIYKTDLARKVGGFSADMAGTECYDLAFKIIEQIDWSQIIHIPKILYHSYITNNSIIGGSKNNKKKAVQNHLKRLKISATVYTLPDGHQRVSFTIIEPAPRVSIIIPTKDQVTLLAKCIDSIERNAVHYPNYEIIIIDNASIEVATKQYLHNLPKEHITVLHDPSPFNYSLLNNQAAKIATGEILCLMNNDIEIITPDWLREMVSFAIRPGVGCVGSRLWYPNGTLQHGGVVLGIGGIACHAHIGIKRENPGYFSRGILHQSFSAVTAACLIVRKEIFDMAGGLDEKLAVAFNDVDFCLRVQNLGFRNVWTPYAEMTHYESATRGHDLSPEKKQRFKKEIQIMQERWQEQLLTDPYYNPNLTLDGSDFSYSFPPRVIQQQHQCCTSL